MLQKRLQRYFPQAPSAQKKPIKYDWAALFFDLNHSLLSRICKQILYKSFPQNKHQTLHSRLRFIFITT